MSDIPTRLSLDNAIHRAIAAAAAYHNATAWVRLHDDGELEVAHAVGLVCPFPPARWSDLFIITSREANDLDDEDEGLAGCWMEVQTDNAEAAARQFLAEVAEDPR